MEIHFMSISGESVKLKVESSSLPATISPLICEKLNRPNRPLNFFRNGKMISNTSKFSELGLHRNDIILFRSHDTHRRKRGLKERPDIKLLHKSIEDSLDNTNSTNSRVYGRYINILKKESDLAKKDPPNMKDLIDQVMAMGFSQENAIDSLRKSRFNVQSAVNDLLNKEEQHSTEELEVHFPFGFVIKHITTNVKPPSESSPYHKHFSMERFTNSDDAGYTPQLEQKARRELERAQNILDKDEEDFRAARELQLNRLLDEENEIRKEEIRRRINLMDSRHTEQIEELQKKVQKAQDRLDTVLQAKRDAHIDDDEDNQPIPQPAPPRNLQRQEEQQRTQTPPSSPPRQRQDSELQSLLSDISIEEQELLQSLITPSISFSEVVQFYLINDRNFEATKAMLM